MKGYLKLFADRILLLLIVLFSSVAGYSAAQLDTAANAKPAGLFPFDTDPYPSTYKPLPAKDILIINATVLDGTGRHLNDGNVLVRNGKIAAIGTDISAPNTVDVIDAEGQWLTPGIVDVHSHLGVYALPTEEQGDLNEMTDPNTANVWAEHSVTVQDRGFRYALAGGVTTLQILPGSSNLFGGRGVTLKTLPASTVQQMKFPGAPYSLKMACGENPKSNYGESNRFPSTRMGNVAGYREAWIEAQEYNRKWEKYRDSKDDSADQPSRDLKLDTLAGVLRGEILVHMHCYRADEMATMIDLAKEFDYKITAFHHAVEAYKIADVLARNQICGALWADWWGFKLEALDAIRENLAFVDAQPSGCAIVHSDSSTTGQRLNIEAATALGAGRDAGLEISDAEAMRWLTLNPARAIGLGDRIGSLEVGKNADMVIWSRNPFSIYSHADKVFIDGALAYDRADPARQPRSDYELGSPSHYEQPR